MSDGSLSQDEIDALLQGTDDVGMDTGFGGTTSTMSLQGDSALSQNEINAFQELLNSCANNVGEALGAMVSKTVKLSNPRIEIVNVNDLKSQIPDDIVEIKMDYDTGAFGEHEYILELNLARVISGLMMGQESADLTDASLSAISEAMNTMSGNASTTIGNRIKKEIRTAPPLAEKKKKGKLSLPSGQSFVKVMYNITLDGTSSTLIEIFSINVVKDITGQMLPASNEMSGFQQQQPIMMGQQKMSPLNVYQGRGPTQVQNVQFGNFNEIAQDSQAGNINLLMDVTMDLTVELGRTKRSIKYILGMGEGTVLELDKLAGEPVDILVNGKLIARGEVVVIDENFGVRVTEIISPADRLQELT
ncbi:MAG: flagellar motor switch protein FliN [Spirochaetes bacterium]|nr:flagellar motor switch protein FliN [Spirochaetota bacterium]